MNTAATAAPVYASACAIYAQAGWPGVIPVPPDSKFPPPDGFTGDHGKYTTAEDLARWIAEKPAYSIALRMPESVVGIDVDQYVKAGKQKRGAETLAARISDWGPLPPTYTSTARGEGQPSRIGFYQVPPGRYAGVAGPDVEIIQRHHRYAVVWPSPHHDDDGAVDGIYAWYDPDGNPVPPGVIPRPEDLPWLPETWIRKLAEGASAAGPAAAGRDKGDELLARLTAEGYKPACVETASALTAATAACQSAEAGSRHDTMTGHVYELVMLGTEGHPGSLAALDQLRQLWNDLTAGEGRDVEFAGPNGFVITAARKAWTKNGGPDPRPYDLCLYRNAGVYQAPVPEGGPDAPEPQPIAPPRRWSPFEAIGAGPFEPAGGLDSMLARDVLARTWPVIRYAADTGSWIIRGPDKWDVRRGELGKWAVDLVSWLMPRGDPDADDGSEEKKQAEKRARFCTNGSANAIAGKMTAQLMAGHHPSSVELADLDGEREILWAGGWPYDLRASAEAPAIAAGYDQGTPHLHSAGTVPDISVPTPLWDAFLAAVWPEEDLRAWALRVLSVAFTGHPDKALPILLGDTDRGKTQVIMLLMSVLGSYAHVADARLLAPADKSHASIVYALKGRRLSFIDEAPRTGQLATERLKQITGGAELTGNRMNENPVTFKPTHTLILTANPEHEPVLTDAAIRRRVRLIPCDGDPAEVIRTRGLIGPEHGPAWRAEAPGVLAKMMRETALWLADPGSAGNGSAPGSATEAVHEIIGSQDLVMSWLREECEDWEPGTRSRELYTAFTESCRRMAIHPSAIPSETRWGRRLRDLGYPPQTHRDANYRQLRVRPPQAFAPTLADLTGKTGGSAGPRGGLTLSGGGFADSSEASAKPSTNGNGAGQTIHPTVHVEGVDSKSTVIAHTQAHAHAHTQGIEKTPLTLQPSTEPVFAEPETPPEPESPSVTKKPKREPKPKAPKPPKQPDPELAGPSYPLPAVVTRDGRVIPCTAEQAALMAMPADGELTVDVETTGYPPGHADYALRTVQLGHAGLAAVFRADDPAQMAAVRQMVSEARILRAHSACADLVPLDHAGLADPEASWAKMHDTVIAAKLADPAMSGSDADGLKALAKDVLREAACAPVADERRAKLFASAGWLKETDVLTPVTRSGWAQIDPECEAMIVYAASDVLDTAAVARQLPVPGREGHDRERSVQRMCARVSHQGLRLDHDRTRELHDRETDLKAAAKDLITGRWGVDNPRSSQQCGQAFAALGTALPRTDPSTRFPEGQPSVAASVLAGIRRQGGDPGELAAALLDYRAHATILSLTLDPFLALCERGDGRARPVVYTINAATGRMSCVRPNLQQIKREGGYRSCIVPDAGLKGISADFASVEIRVAAALSQDPALIAMIRNGDACPDRKQEFDLHWQVNRQVWKDEATKSTRYGIKRAVFGHMYGGAAQAMADGAEIPLEAAYAVKETLAALAPVYTDWDRKMRAYVKQGGREFRAYTGRPIWLPKRQHHAAGNYAIQGTARELLCDALIRWQQTPWGGCVILPVHDEIIAFVPEAEAASATQALVACMRTELYGVPIAAEAAEPWTAWPDAS